MKKMVKTLSFVIALIMIMSTFSVISVFAENVTRADYAAHTRKGSNLYLFDNVAQDDTGDVAFGAAGTDLIRIASAGQYKQYKDGYGMVINGTQGDSNAPTWGFQIRKTQAAFAINGYFSIRYKVVGATDEYLGVKTISNGFAVREVAEYSMDYTIENDKWSTATVQVTTLVSGTPNLGWLAGEKGAARCFTVKLPELNAGAYYVIDYCGEFTSTENIALQEAASNAFWQTLEGEPAENDGIVFAGAQAKTGEKGVRFIGTVDNYLNDNYDEFGFVLTANGVAANKDAKVTKVYKSIVANNDVVTPEIFNSANKAGSTFFTFCLNDIDKDYTFTVAVYAVINGQKVVGQSYTYQYTYATGTVAAV